MRLTPLLFCLLTLAACNRGIDNKEAVRQGVVDYLASRPNLNIGAMKVDVTSVSFKGNEAEAMVSFTPKDSKMPGQGMSIPYTLEKKGNRWVVKPRAAGGGSPHGAMPPGMPNPHGGSTMPGGTMPPTGNQGAGEMPAGHPPTGNSPGTQK